MTCRCVPLDPSPILFPLSFSDKLSSLSKAPNEADDAPPTSLESVADEKALSSLPSNLRTIQYSVLEHLSSVQRPCAHQQPRHVSSFLSALRRWERGYDVEGVTLSDPPEAVLGGEPSSGAEQSEGLFRGQEDLEESYEGDRTMGEVTMGGEQGDAGTSNSQPVPRVAKESRLTKGERLMLVNHAPMTLIELHCVSSTPRPCSYLVRAPS